MCSVDGIKHLPNQSACWKIIQSNIFEKYYKTIRIQTNRGADTNKRQNKLYRPRLAPYGIRTCGAFKTNLCGENVGEICSGERV